MPAAALESPAGAFQSMFDLVVAVGNEDPAAVAGHRKPAELVAEGLLAEWEADQELDKNILGCLRLLKGGYNQEALPLAAGRRTGIVLAGADLRAGAACIAAQRLDFVALRWCCLGCDEYGNCDPCSRVEAARELCNKPVGAVAVADMPARLLGSSQELAVLEIVEAVAAGSSCAAIPRLPRRVYSIAEG